MNLTPKQVDQIVDEGTYAVILQDYQEFTLLIRHDYADTCSYQYEYKGWGQQGYEALLDMFERIGPDELYSCREDNRK